MLTLAAQTATGLCLLVFALYALRVAREIAPSAIAFRFGWVLTGGAFLIQAVNLLFHNLLSIAAYVGGEGSAAWRVISWHPIFNHSRTFLLAAFCGVLCMGLVRAGRRAPLPTARTWIPMLLGGMVLGGIVGLNEEAFSASTHYSAVALWDMVELLLMLSVLFVGMVTGRMERTLWFCLGVNAFVLAISVLTFAALTQIDVGGQWVPRPWHVQMAKVPLYLLMIAIARRQLWRVRNGRPMRSFIEPPTSQAVLPSMPR
jgi:hypothetical protein